MKGTEMTQGNEVQAGRTRTDRAGRAQWRRILARLLRARGARAGAGVSGGREGGGMKPGKADQSFKKTIGVSNPGAQPSII